MKPGKKPITIGIIAVVVVALIAGVYFIFLRGGKSGSGVTRVEMAMPDNTKDIFSNIDEAVIEKSMTKENLRVRGWVYHQDAKNKHRELFLVLMGSGKTLVYALENGNSLRPDVTQYYKLTGGVDNHGFEAMIPMEDLQGESYGVGFIIKDKSGDHFAMSQKEISLAGGEAKVVNSKFTDNTAPITIQAGNGKIKFYFDQFEATAEKIQMRGWAFLEGMSTDSLKTYIVLKKGGTSTAFSAVPYERKDVTDHFKEMKLNLDNCGFSCLIDARTLASGKYEVYLYLVNRSQTGLINTGKTATIGG